MKRIAGVFLLVFCAAVMVSAQGFNNRDNGGFFGGPGRGGWGYPSPAEAVTFSGNLALVQGMIAITGDDMTYIARGLDRFVGFIDGFKEGASIDIEGYAMPLPQNDKVRLLEIQKMTLNGKEYDLGQGFRDGGYYCQGPGFGRMGMGCRRGGMGYGMGRGDMMYGW